MGCSISRKAEATADQANSRPGGGVGDSRTVTGKSPWVSDVPFMTARAEPGFSAQPSARLRLQNPSFSQARLVLAGALQVEGSLRRILGQERWQRPG